MCDSYDKQTCRCAECRPGNELVESMSRGHARVRSSFGDEREMWILSGLPGRKRKRRLIKQDSLLAQEIRQQAINRARREKAKDRERALYEYEAAARYFKIEAVADAMSLALNPVWRGPTRLVASPLDPLKVVRVRVYPSATPAEKRPRRPAVKRGTFMWRGKRRPA